jgi:hypothetical protein
MKPQITEKETEHNKSIFKKRTKKKVFKKLKNSFYAKNIGSQL